MDAVFQLIGLSLQLLVQVIELVLVIVDDLPAATEQPPKDKKQTTNM